MSDDETWRLFVALPVADHVRVLAQAAVAPARDVAPELTWTRPEGWHLTLAFLGAVPVDAVPDAEGTVGDAVAASAVGPIGCTLGAADRFRRRILVLAVEDEPAGAIATLGEVVQEALAAALLPVERRSVRPHLTLARASRGSATVTDDVVGSIARVEVGWEADEVHLVRSHLGGGPARYETVASWSLAQPA